jgi:hypothetical protein
MYTVTTEELTRALEGVAEFFHQRQTRAGILARRALGISPPDDVLLADELIRERRRSTRLDGGVGGWVMATTWSAWELLQLGCPPDHTGLSRMVGYLLNQQNKPGRYGEGCSDRRHRIGHCHHFMEGFFSPATRDDAVAPVQFPSGVVIVNEWEARFAASCFALRTVLQARQEGRPLVRAHLNSLFHLAERWENQEFEAAPDLLFLASGCFAVAPLDDRQRSRNSFAALGARQLEDGTWEGASLFNALEALLLAPFPETSEAVKRAAPEVIRRQRTSGAFDEEENEEVALIALRTLRAHGLPNPIGRPKHLSTAARRR